MGVERQVAVLSWNGQRRVLEQRRAVLGRSRDADVQIEDANVSRRHAEIVQEGSVFWVVDLGSTNGTEVDGRRVQRHQLQDGDRLHDRRDDDHLHDRAGVSVAGPLASTGLAEACSPSRSRSSSCSTC